MKNLYFVVIFGILLNFHSISVALPAKFSPKAWRRTKNYSSSLSINDFFQNFFNWNKFWNFGNADAKIESDLNKVLVFGATGRTGVEIVKACAEYGLKVVAASKNETKAANLLAAAKDPKMVSIANGVDITNSSTLTANVFDGVSQIVSVVGPSFSNPNFTAENVDYKGVLNIIEAAKLYLPDTKLKSLALFSSKDRNQSSSPWRKLDDVIMGGSSSSSWIKSSDNEKVSSTQSSDPVDRWTGTVVTEGGGFCGTVLELKPQQPISKYDGVFFRVRGDGYRYKFRIGVRDPTSSRSSSSSSYASNINKELIYSASFNTIANTWIDVQIPFEDFTATKQARVDYFQPPLSSQPSISSVGFILSKFEYNGLLNPTSPKGAFSLDVEEIQLYSSPRPQVVLVSSAGTERYNRYETAEQRARDIPIIQLNPQGILNWKYKAEQALRSSGLRYTVLRPTGIFTGVPDTVAGSTSAPVSARLAERPILALQGDYTSGRITRTELASVVVTALTSAFSAGKTAELRRDETDGVVLSREGLVPATVDLFRPLVSDVDRAVQGLPPFPVAQDPPGDVSEEEKQKILNDPRVVSQQARERAAVRELPAGASAV